MIPSALVSHLEEGMRDFLRASFWSASPAFDGLLDRFLESRDALFKGPYISMQLPFKQGNGQTTFARVPLKHPPYAHQELAFKRLGVGKNTIVATGTGSGKTECFAVPLLAHCAERLSERGIKAIILYPMNALANDQAERLAQLVHENEILRGNLNIGMYVGQHEKSPHTTMGPAHVITDRNTLRSNPPDILLTNYKMLDYLLLRPEDQPLWQDNGPETLKYLVVDELHTFDGAQGTDLACLIRRLRARLGTPKAHLCAVGTSATLSSDSSAAQALIEYATQVFGEPFDRDAIVRESRLDSRDFLLGAKITADPEFPTDKKVYDPAFYTDEKAYLDAQMTAWFGKRVDPIELGHELKKSRFLINLLGVFDSNNLYAIEELAHELFSTETPNDPELSRLRTLSLLALTSTARRENGLPFVQIRIQLWQRELRRMVASVGPQPQLNFHDDLQTKDRQNHLPVVYCRDCGLMGWGCLVSAERSSHLQTNLQDFYKAYFDSDSRVSFIFLKEENPEPQFGVGASSYWLNHKTLIRQQQKPDSLTDVVEVVIPASKRMSHGRLVLDHDCPQCLAPQGLSLLGYQAASLTSTFIGQLFASRFNSDRRLLTFSDSVQDAAHRAGFFGARTWSFNVRIAIQHVVASLDEELTLQELTKRVPEYWRAKLGDSQFVATFIPPNLEWMNEYEELKSRGELKGTYLTELVTRRMSWEVYQEYTFRSEFGRTLQRSGASALKVDQSRFDKAVALATQRLFEELRIQTDHTSMAHALMGFVVRMRTRGAVYYPDLPHDYLKSGGKNTFVFGKKWAPFLPLAGPGTRLPAFWTDTSGTARFEHINGQSAGSWAPRWVTRVLESNHMMMASFARETTEVLLRSMVDAGLVEKHTDQITTWGLKLDALSVTKDLVQMRTSKARLRHWVPRAEAAVWEGMQALTQPAGGVWQAVQAHVPAGSGYYAVLYNSGDVTRVNTAEHTGLLERDEREQVETSFKTEPQRPWDVNLLSCTPTLEMGIDIGLLSTAILCSVPPGVANYIQRVGRAGRKDGNSLILTIANGTEHDLYFFANPLEMLKGHVEPPGVFLNASAVLNRQLTAYCLDRWISQKNITRKDFPKKVQEALSGLKRYEERDKFPHNFIEYVDLNQSLLLSGFFNLFEEMTDETREKVTTFMRGGHGTEGSLPWSLIHRLQGLSAERDQRQSDVKSLSSRIKKIEALPTRSPAEEEELSELRRERRAIEGLLRSLNDRDTLNFLTDEGLIPNYAFPEAGVSLKSIIWKRTKEGEDEAGAHYENLEFSYERPARSAIVELAPDAKFYAGGRRVRVNQVDIKKTVPEPWRFCPSCTYADVASGTHTKNCPSCDSPGWGDAGQKREMLKLSQVFAWTKDSESRIDDERDEREASFFNKQMLVHFPGDMKSEAWHLTKEEVPFGAEYVAGATFREINFGPRKSDGTKFTIAGVEAVREGFVLCNSCGMVQGKTKVHHAPSCKFKNAPQAATYETALYLYREFKSEAVRLLLPFIDEPGQSRKLHSFVAALELGLRKYFGGKIDHLQSALHSEPSEEGHRRKQFLVLYDTVPGGTGYLREMIRDEKRIFEILEKAQATLRSCPCVEEEDKDGCYRCVYAYRHARDMADTSRSTAFEEISRILSHRDTWKPIQSLGKVSISALLDSLLEAKFIEALIRRVEAAGGEVNKILIRGKTGYGLNLGEHSWRLEPQVDIGEAQGVVKHSRVDFVLWPEREGDMRPIAVFTDGIKYHQHRLEVDFAQRMALLASERYWVFSLTWDDVEAAMEGGSPNVADILQTPSANTDLMRKALQILARQNSGFTQNWDFGLSSFDLLFHIMSTRSVKMFKEAVGATTLALAAGQRIPQDVWQNNIGEFCVPNVADSLKTSVGPSWMTGGVEVPDPQTRGPAAADVRVFVALAAEAAQTGDISQSVGILWIDDTPQRTESDDFKRQWKAFLWALNRLQMLRTLFVLTSEKQHEVEFSQLLNLMTIPYGADAHAAHREAWNTVFEFSCFDPEIRRIAEGWRDLPPPEAGFDFMANNRQVGFAELAWVEAKVAILLPPDQDEEYARSRKAFEHHGWLVFDFLEVTVGELGHAIESRGGRR